MPYCLRLAIGHVAPVGHYDRPHGFGMIYAPGQIKNVMCHLGELMVGNKIYNVRH